MADGPGEGALCGRKEGGSGQSSGEGGGGWPRGLRKTSRNACALQRGRIYHLFINHSYPSLEGADEKTKRWMV